MLTIYSSPSVVQLKWKNSSSFAESTIPFRHYVDSANPIRQIPFFAESTSYQTGLQRQIRNRLNQLSISRRLCIWDAVTSLLYMKRRPKHLPPCMCCHLLFSYLLIPTKQAHEKDSLQVSSPTSGLLSGQPLGPRLGLSHSGHLSM